MAWKPKPFKLTCKECGWSKTFAPQSDVQFKPIPEKCPKCGSANLKQNVIQGSLFGALADIFGEKR